MAPVPTDTDLLDYALKNKTVLPSWRSIYTRLSEPSAPSHVCLTQVSSFLSSPSSRTALGACYNAFSLPSAQSKKEFETRIAPINFTAADQPAGLPSIAELKGAALDLSKSLNIDEVSALRIVVLENQRRPVRSLLEAAGGDNEFGAGSAPGQLGESILRASQLVNESETKRKAFFDRVEVYLSERRYVIKVATTLLRAATSPSGPKNPWRETGRQFMRDCREDHKNLMEELVDGIDKRWNERNDGNKGLPGWVKERIEDPEIGPQVALAWERQTLLEIVHLLQLFFLHLYRPMGDVSGMLVMKWFQLMEQTKFLSDRSFVQLQANLEIDSLQQYVLLLTTVVSLAVLQIPKALKFLIEEFRRPSSTESSATPPATGPQSPPRPDPTISDKEFYIRNPSAIGKVTRCLQRCPDVAAASLAGAGWVLILDRITLLTEGYGHEEWSDDEGTVTGVTSQTLEMLTKVLPPLFPTTVLVGVQSLARQFLQASLKVTAEILGATDSGYTINVEEDGLRMKNIIAHLIRSLQRLLEISKQSVMTSVLSVDVEYDELQSFSEFLQSENTSRLEPDATIVADQEDNFWEGNPAERLWTDDYGGHLFLERVRNRFPFEPIAFLESLRALSTSNRRAVEFLTSMDTCTQLLPPGFRDYDIVDEDADVMQITLLTDLEVFPSRGAGIFQEETYALGGIYGSSGGIIIPSGTTGVVTSTGGSRAVVAWRIKYNALPMLGRALECALDHGTSIPAVGDLVSEDGRTEIVRLLTMLVATSEESAAASARRSGHCEVPQVLEEASDMLGRNRDVISVIFDLLEAALNRNTEDPFLVAGIRFVDSLVHIIPGRVWPYLARSCFLERRGRGGAFHRILSAFEATRGRYDLTIATISLFEKLVEEAVRSSAVHKGRSKSVVPISRQLPARGTGGMGVSDSVQQEILLAFMQSALDVFEAHRGFKYIDIGQRLEIGTRLARTFGVILNYVYGVDDTTPSSEKITSVLAPSAEHLVDAFLPTSASELPLGPIFSAIDDGVHTPETSLHVKSLAAWVDQVVRVLEFADLLVRCRAFLQLSPSQLEKQLYSASAQLAKVFAVNEQYKHAVLGLLESLIRASDSYPDEPPSLLGYLGPAIANHFVTLLSGLDKPYHEIRVESRIWNLCSAIVSNKQQGMSILLLRGETLRQNGGTTSSGKRPSILSVCLDAVEDIDRLSVEKTLAMLTFVATAQNFWSLAMEDLGRHPRFLQTITKHVESFKIEIFEQDSMDLTTDKAYKVAVAAYIARILALYLHSRRPSQRDKNFFEQLLPKLNYYFERAVRISGYRASLHARLPKNVEDKWPGVRLTQFKKTRLRRTEYGQDAIYDTVLASKVLGFDPSWAVPDGYQHEVRLANVNLSLTQTQVDLLQSWELLAIELCNFVETSPEATKSLIKVVETCLRENIEAGTPAPIFEQIVTRRCEFAFVIVRKLYTTLPKIDLSHVFKITWVALSASIPDFRASLSSANMDYYRSLLRIIYISILSFTARAEKDHPTEFNFMILDLLDVLICKGFKDLAQAAYSHSDKPNPQDLALLTAILQACLKLQGIQQIHLGLLTHLQENNTVRAAVTLFSWSDQLPGGPEDPIYPELAVLFLVQLSSVPAIAEHIAIENTLPALLSCPLSSRIRKGSITPAEHSRLHALWTRGFLPLVLNLLVYLNARIGRDVLSFIQYFEPQINTAIEGWRKPAVVVSSAVEEAVNIAMLVAVLMKLGATKEEVGVDTGVMVEGVGYLLMHRNYLKSLCLQGEEEVEAVEKGLAVVQALLGGEEED